MALNGDELCFPVHGTHEVVIIPARHLPEETEDILDLLTSEALPLAKWFDVARAYLSQNKEKQFLDVLREGTDDHTVQEIEQFFKAKPTFELIQFHCAYAAYYIHMFRKERDQVEKAKHQRDAIMRINAAKQLSSQEQLPWLASGFLALAKDDQLGAMKDFREAAKRKHNGHANIAGYLAQAAVQFNQNKFHEALDLYRLALRENPLAPAEVRLGLGACYFRLGNLAKSEAAYERVLALDSGNAEALLGLATIKFASPNIQQGLASGLQLLVRAYHADPSHPGVLTSLAHFSLLKGEHERALQLATAALEYAENSQLRALATTTLARAYHAMGQLSKAQNLYAQASRLDPKLPLPHLGSAQMCLRNGMGEAINAASELEAVLAAAPGCLDALRLLAGLLPQVPDRVMKTSSHFVEAAARRPDDAQVQEALAELLSRTDPVGSLAAYKEALKLHRAKQSEASAKVEEHNNKQTQASETSAYANGDQQSPEPYYVPARLLNNAAVLFYRSGQIHEAMQLMQEATANMMRNGSGSSGVSALHKVTMGYNMARLQEATGDLKSASAGYKALLEQFPGYIDCYLRLACIARTSGSMDDAVDWATKATDMEGGHVDAQSLLAMLYLEQRNNPAAKMCLDRILKVPEMKKDPYTQLALASYYLKCMPALTKTEKDVDIADRCLRLSEISYREVLTAEPRNVYAANGLGVVLAERGSLDAARDTFSMVQEAAAASGGFVKLPDVWINLANLYLAKQNYASAIQMYLNASKVYNNKNSKVLLYLARAYYDDNNLMAAKRTLLKAVHVVPQDFTLRFNVALTMQEWSQRIYGKARPENDPTKFDEFQEAYETLDQALKIFAHLERLGKAVTRIEPRKLKAHVSYCKESLAKAERYVRTAEAQQVEMNLKREEQDRQYKKLELDKLEAEVQKRALEKAEKMKREEVARKAMLDLQSKLDDIRQSRMEPPADGDATASGKGSKKKRKKGASGAGSEDDGFINDDALVYDRTGGKARGGAEYVEQEDPQELLRRTGLASDDEDDEDKINENKPQSSQPQQQTPGKTSGRLKKRGGGDVIEDIADDDLFADLDDEQVRVGTLLTATVTCYS
eukprot:jgi/Chrzof1/1187/Cz01g43270.t1